MIRSYLRLVFALVLVFLGLPLFPRRAVEDTVVERRATTWRFELDMHPKQREIFEHPARFKVAACGRRFGKTLLAVAMALVVATSKDDAVVWWVAPSHPQARIALRLIAKVVPNRHRDVNRTLGEIYLSNGGRIVFKSGERFDNLRGEGIDLVICDEAAFLQQEVWTQALRPALSDTNGSAFLISTFNGENWFFDLYRFAIDPENTEWEGWRLPTSCNPYIPAGEIEEARRSLPKEVFDQEYEASPLAFQGAVFEGEKLDLAWIANRDLVIKNGTVHEAGLDWGWNVTALEVCVELADGRIAWVEEHIWTRVELGVRCEEIAEVCKRLNIATIYADAAGATENVTLAKTLDRTICQTDVQPVPFNVWKKPGITTRNFYLQNGREIIGPGCKKFLIDSKAYHYDAAGEKPAKGNDHTVDAGTAFYASRAYVLGDEMLAEAVA